MAQKRDYYEVLGVGRDASEKQIADAYRKLAVQYHPDKNPGDEETVGRFKEAAEAFEVLSESQKRSLYDRHGHAGVGGAAPHFNDVSDIFQAFGDIFGDSLFGDLFGGRTSRGGRRVSRGADVRCDVTIDLLEAARGVSKQVEFDRHERCTDCNGSGAKPPTQPENCTYCGGHGQVIRSSGILRVQTTCPSCKGSGTVIREPCPHCRGHGHVRRHICREVRIPAGVDSSTRLRLTAEGEPSPNGGPAGDCYCFIQVTDHPLLQRQGQHLICEVPISYTQAVLGGTVEVPTLEGREEFTIPPGTQPGEVFKLRGRGMPDPHGRGAGHLHIQLNVEVPTKLQPREEELLRKLAQLEHNNVTPHRMSFFEKLRDYFVVDEDDSTEKLQ